MSISNRHSVVPFTASVSKAMDEQRLSIVRYKKDNPIGLPNVCVSIPSLDDKEITKKIEQLIPFVKSMVLEIAQDGIIKSLYESSNGAVSSISDEEISIDACIAYLSAVHVQESKRLTKEVIGTWFDIHMESIVASILCEKLNLSVSDDGVLSEKQSEILEPHLAGWKGVFMSLSGGTTILQKKQINNLRYALSLVDTDDGGFMVASKLIKRLDVMEESLKEKMDAKMLDLV